MNISFNWLNEFLKIDLKIEELSKILTDIAVSYTHLRAHET